MSEQDKDIAREFEIMMEMGDAADFVPDYEADFECDCEQCVVGWELRSAG